jgi:hypothetical protein
VEEEVVLVVVELVVLVVVRLVVVFVVFSLLHLLCWLFRFGGAGGGCNNSSIRNTIRSSSTRDLSFCLYINFLLRNL